MTDLSKALAILSSMIAPVVLIMACGSMILATSQRLSRVIERTRKLTDQLRTLVQNKGKDEYVEEEALILSEQMLRATRRAKLLQRAMTSLYIALSIFVATSISLGITDIAHAIYVWIPVGLGITGAMFLFYASIVLIRESRIAITAVNEEMNYSIRFFNRHFPEIAKKPDASFINKLTGLLRRFRKAGS